MIETGVLEPLCRLFSHLTPDSRQAKRRQGRTKSRREAKGHRTGLGLPTHLLLHRRPPRERKLFLEIRRSTQFHRHASSFQAPWLWWQRLTRHACAWLGWHVEHVVVATAVVKAPFQLSGMEHCKRGRGGSGWGDTLPVVWDGTNKLEFELRSQGRYDVDGAIACFGNWLY